MTRTETPYPGDLLDHLRAFVALSACVERDARGAFGRAATELAVDVSVLRRRMQTLAGWMGGALLEGRGGGLRLTRAGARARVHAVRALEATAELTRAADDDASPLRVAATGTIVAELLPPAFRALRAVHPHLLFRVRRAGADASRTLVTRGEVDFAVVRSASRPSGVEAVRLGADRLWLAVPARSPLAKSSHARVARLKMATIAREPLIGYLPSSSTMRRIMQVLGPHGATPWLEVDGKAAALAYVSAGLGIAFVSALAPRAPVFAGVAMRDVTASFGAVSFWLIWREGAAMPASHRQFVDEIVTRRLRWPARPQ